MKLEKITHDHLLTKWLKVIIFSLLMLAPIFSIAIKCAYVICNKNAYQSYYGETINEKQINNITNLDNFIIGNEYFYDHTSNPNLLTNTGLRLSIENINNYEGTGKTTIDNNLDNIKYLYYANSGTANAYIGFQNSNYDTILNINFNNSFSFNFTYLGKNNTNIDTEIQKDLFIVTYNSYSYLDNVFDYSVNQLRNDQLFNWTQNTGVYTGVNAMTTGLGMTDSTIAILLTYWMLLTIIYVIIDIVLAGFTMLTHMIYNKKAE